MFFNKKKVFDGCKSQIFFIGEIFVIDKNAGVAKA